MTPLTQQLEDKKKGCRRDLIYKPFTYRCQCGDLIWNEIDGVKEIRYCQICEAEIAILEQAIAEMQKQRQEILGREIKMQCLICGYSLQKEILDKKIHIHFCKECRLKELDRITNELNQPKTEND